MPPPGMFRLHLAAEIVKAAGFEYEFDEDEGDVDDGEDDDDQKPDDEHYNVLFCLHLGAYCFYRPSLLACV